MAQFRERYAACVADLQALWATGLALGLALRTEVPMPLPTRVVTSLVDGVARGVPIRADVAGVVDDEAARLGAATRPRGWRAGYGGRRKAKAKRSTRAATGWACCAAAPQ